MAGGVALYLAARQILSRATAAAPLINRFDGKRMFEFAAQIARPAGCERLTRWLFHGAPAGAAAAADLRVLASALIPLSNGGLPAGDLAAAPVDPHLRSCGWSARRVRSVRRWQAKYHRLAALILSVARARHLPDFRLVFRA